MQFKRLLKNYDLSRLLPTFFWVIVVVLVFFNRSLIVKSFNPFVELTYIKPVMPQITFDFPFPVMVGANGNKSTIIDPPLALPEKGKGQSNSINKMPFFPAGNDSMIKFIRKNVNYPEEALKNKISGQVLVQFMVTEKGKIVNPKIIHGIGYGCDEEIIRIVKLFPKWNPAFQEGKSVKSYFNLPVEFYLD
jgi:TonB family protein